MNAINDHQCLARGFSFLKRISKFQSLVTPAKKYLVNYAFEGYKIFPEVFLFIIQKCEFNPLVPGVH